tara:strand:+ start:22 stop:333 length:312 start_codon:yes stop_codon:yes gene_type:complete
MELKDLIRPIDIEQKLKSVTYAQLFCVLNILKNERKITSITSRELAKITNENYSHLYQILEVFAATGVVYQIKMSRMRCKWALMEVLDDKKLLKLAKKTLDLE